MAQLIGIANGIAAHMKPSIYFCDIVVMMLLSENKYDGDDDDDDPFNPLPKIADNGPAAQHDRHVTAPISCTVYHCIRLQNE